MLAKVVWSPTERGLEKECLRWELDLRGGTQKPQAGLNRLTNGPYSKPAFSR